MQVLFVPSLLLFFSKFFMFFFCKEGLKEIQPPSQCFWPFWTWLCLNFQGFVCIVHLFVWFVLCFRVVHFYARRFKELRPLHCVFGYLQVSRVEKALTLSQWFCLLVSRVQKALTPSFSQCFCLLLCFRLVSTPLILLQCFCFSLCFQLVCWLCFLQSSSTSTIPRTQPLPCHCVLYLIFDMFPRSYSFFDSGPKLPLVGAWPKYSKSNINPLGITKSLELQNPSFSFAICEVLPKIPNLIDVDPNEIPPKILDFIILDLDEILEVSNSQFDLQINPPWRNMSLVWVALGKSLVKSHMIIIESSMQNDNKITMSWGVSGYWRDYLDWEVQSLLLDWEQRQNCQMQMGYFNQTC